MTGSREQQRILFFLVTHHILNGGKDWFLIEVRGTFFTVKTGMA